MSRNKSVDIFTALTVVIGIGAVLGVLFAPQSGEETRDYLRQTAKDRLDDAVETGKQYTRRAQKSVEKARDFANDTVEKGKDYAQRAQDTVQDTLTDAQKRAQDLAGAGERAYREARNAS